ncbi:CIC11C00000000887 [Sungouiella intermedia]|uniref:CIC11C00000000887 n=1 Tax=Sungouiella intermedia TaxID=45354 RepID=A0A1L0GHY7_9ASCO|nr:CIC11C00000000887 [[Candida] intermedia]
MSVKAEITEKILSLVRTLPKDRIAHYASFKDVQLERFLNKEVVDTISEKDLKLQYFSLRDLVNDKYKNYYKLDDKMLKPKGNPQYYERLMADLKGEKKETFGSAMRTVVFGK